MFLDQPSQIMALIRSGKLVNIGGRPVLVPTPRQPERLSRHREDIKLALAFAAPEFALAQSTSPFETGATALVTSLTTLATPVAAMLVMALVTAAVWLFLRRESEPLV